MELYQLKTFVAVAHERSLTRAAEKVFTSPPAVSAQIKALEDELGVRLFDRSARGMELTEPGARLLDEAERTLDAATRMRSAAAQIRGAAQGVVRFGTVSDPVSLKLGELLVKLAERHPQVTLQLQQGRSADALAALQRGDLDCAYLLSDRENVPGLDLYRLTATDIVVTMPPAIAEAHPDLTLDSLTRLPWVGTPPNCALRTALDRLFAAAGREYQPGTMADTEGGIRSMVASGLGAGLVRAEAAAEAERRGELRIWPGWRTHTWICWAAPPEERCTSAVRAVRGVVREVWNLG